MKKFLSVLSALLMLSGFSASAQIITTSPRLLQEKSKNVVLTYHADAPQGNGGLKGLASSVNVYAHIGVITNKSTSVSDWKYAPAWGDNAAKYKLTYVSANTYTLNIGDIRTYFGMTDASEKVEKIALVFRTEDKSKEGKTSSGGDIFVDILADGYQMALTSDAASNVLTKATKINFSVDVTDPSTITLAVNGTTFGSTSNATSFVKDYTFSSTGSYKVVATATNGTETRTSEITISYPKASVQGNYPGGVPKMGAVENNDGSVTFCLAAPGKTSAVLVPSWDNFDVSDKNSMKYQDYNGNRYFWITVPSVPAGYNMYYYLVDGVNKVGDPYAHLVLDPYSDKWLDASIWPDMPKYPYDKFDDTMLAVYRKDLDNYKFSNFNIPAASNLVIYELLFRDFTGTNDKADANGTVRKAIEKIPYLKELGVTAVELMPIMEFNGNNSWGYNTNFYMAPDKSYGSPKDYKDFIEICHQNGIAVILDIVFNQSDGLHPWYQLYPIASNPFYNQYAPHDYSVLNDWNQDNVLVQQYWKDVLTYWLTAYNVDGFRFDLVKGLGSNSSYGSGTEAYNASRIENMKRLHAHIKAVKPNAFHINEHLAGASEENQMANDGQYNWANINYGSQQYAMGYGNGMEQTIRFNAANDSRNWGSTVSYAESHDEQRVAYKQNTNGASGVKGNVENSMKRLGALATQLLLMPGPKMIWQFGELGADENTKKSDGGNNVDPKVVVWNYIQNPDRKALHDTYQALCSLRKDNPELFTQSAAFVPGGFSSSLTSMRTIRLTSGNKEVVAFINPNISGANRSISCSATVLNSSNYQLITASKGFNPTLNSSGSNVNCSVPPHCYAVFATKSVTSNDDVLADNLSSDCVVFGGYGEIVIVGEYDNVQVYNIQGQLQPSLSVPAGLYIVNVDGKSSKVVVK